jgi:hypothetical protein
VSSDPSFLEAYRLICSELVKRDALSDGGLGRESGSGAAAPGPDTLATFYYALAADALVRAELSEITSRNSSQGR